MPTITNGLDNNSNIFTTGVGSVITAGNASLTARSGDITISGTGVGAGGNINIPQTNATNTLGTVKMASTRFLYSDVATTSVYLGLGAGNSTNTTSGNTNVYIGADAGGLGGATTQTVAIGHRAGRQLQLASANNIAIGKDSLLVGTTAAANIALGSSSLFQLTTGAFNISIGYAPTSNTYTSSESNNILIANAGVLGESNTMRLGTSGATAARVNRCFLAGTYGITPAVSGTNQMVISNDQGQLGTQTLPSSFTWTVVTGATQAISVNNGYISNRAGLVTYTLPASAAVGDMIRVTLINSSGSWTIAQNASQTIKFGNIDSTAGVGGSISSSANGDTVEIICTVANTNFVVLSSIGNITYV